MTNHTQKKRLYEILHRHGVVSSAPVSLKACRKSDDPPHLEVKLNVHVFAEAARIVVAQRLGVAEGLLGRREKR